MKRFAIVVALIALSGCGYSSKDNELVGQIKKTMNNTPFMFPDYKDCDVSLGVIRGNVGSMSNQDVWVRLDTPELFERAKKANETGAIVKITYDAKRFAWYGPERIATKLEVVN